MNPDVNPFAALSLIVAPALLTNASTLMVLSTSNRLARAVDRGRQLAIQLETSTPRTEAETQMLLRELDASGRRMVLLVRALRKVYLALACFASATLLSLFGAVLAPWGVEHLTVAFEVIAVAAGALAVGSLVLAALQLIQESSIVVGVFAQRAAQLEQELARRRNVLRGPEAPTPNAD